MTPHREQIGFQGPTTGDTARTYGELFSIVTHPAFRIGFLDAQAGRALDHDKIADRIVAETPPKAFERIGIDTGNLFAARAVELAQYRYEEGRLAVVMCGLSCKAWGHPDFPPAAVRKYIWERADKTPRVELPASITACLRASAAGPLFEARA